MSVHGKALVLLTNLVREIDGHCARFMPPILPPDEAKALATYWKAIDEARAFIAEGWEA